MTSILLPTIRPEKIETCLSQLMYSEPDEVIVVADFEPQFTIDCRVKWIIEERQGPVAAVNRAFKEAQCEYIFVYNDESILYKGSLEAMEAEFKKGSLQIVTPVHEPYFPFYYYKKFFAAFPFTNREVLQRLNCGEYVFDPAFKGFYADPDLSLRAWHNKIQVNVCQGAKILHTNDIKRYDHVKNVEQYLNHDRRMFENRWSTLGELVDP